MIFLHLILSFVILLGTSHTFLSIIPQLWNISTVSIARICPKFLCIYVFVNKFWTARISEMLRKVCGGSNLSTDLLLWGIYIKKCISPVRICLQTRNARNASTKFWKTLESKKAEKSLEISAFLVFSCLHLNQTRIMAGVAGFGPTNAGVKVPCLTAWLHPTNFLIISHQPVLCQVIYSKYICIVVHI